MDLLSHTGTPRLADLRTQLDEALSPNYRIARELGGGGMSRVFLADDLSLERQVVVKVLPPEMAVGVSTDRFRREMQLVARLQHPHIVPILSTGIAGDVLYYIMPYIHGESLRSRLARDVAIPVAEAALILREVADALGFAHGLGVVHRDIKPDNVMLTSGHALVTDFGVAKALSAPDTAADPEGLTSVGLALGTPTYMAPEQAAADPRVDHRADIYALGVMAYEMLSGQPPFVAPTAQALLAAHVTREPEPLRVSRPAVPEALEILVMRCLAKRPPDRYQHAVELLPILDSVAHPSGVTEATRAVQAQDATPSALRIGLLFFLGSVAVIAVTWLLRQVLGLPDWVVSGAVVLLLVGFPVTMRAARAGDGRLRPGPLGWLGSMRGALAAGGLAFLGLGAAAGGFMVLRALGVGPFATLLSAGTITEKDRILVAEFSNTTPDSMLGPALTEALTIDLSQSKVVRLMAPSEISEALERMQRDIGAPLTRAVATEMAAREGVKVIVAGEISPLAGGYALSARVLDPAGTTLFAVRATADKPGDVLPALETVSRKLREGIGESLRSIRSTQSLEQVTTSSLEALQLYSRAMRNSDRGGDEDNLSLLRQAVALDSNFAMAWRRIAGDLINSNGSLADILDAAGRASQLSDRLPAREALLSRALYLEFEGEFEEEAEIYSRVLASWPDDKSARNNLGLLLRVSGRYSDAEKMLSPGVDSGTAPASTYYNLATSQIPQSRFEAAERTRALLQERYPDSPMRWQVGYFLATATHQDEVALAAADSLTRAGTRYRYWGYLYRANIQRLHGRLREADRTTQALIRNSYEQGNPGGALMEELMAAWADLQLGGDSAGAARRVATALATTPLDSLTDVDRPYGDLIRLYAALGMLEEARAVQREYTNLIPAPYRKGDARGLRGLAQLALAEGRPQEAIPLARRASVVAGCDGCTGNLIGAAYAAFGQVDSAISAYERSIRPPTYGSEFRNWRPLELPLAYFRLGELYELRRQPVLARDRYASFVDLWQDADPELQPAVAEARARMRALAGEP